MEGMSEQELIRFFDRMNISGEMEAMRWVLDRQRQP
jgi:hypothetical protein